MRRSAGSVVTATVIAVPTLIYVAALLFDPARTLVLWERATPPLLPLSLLAASLIAHAAFTLIILARMPAQLSHRQIFLLLTYVVLAGLVLQTVATHIVEPFPLRGLAFRQYSDFTGGYFTVGVRVDDLGAWLRRFAQEMESYNVHAERHPPGLPMIFWAGVQVLRPFPALAEAMAPVLRPLACFDLRAATLNDVQIAAGLFGIVVETALAWLTPILLFFFVRQMAGDRAAATAALLYPLAPGALMWASQWDRGFGVFTLAGLLLVERLVAQPSRAKSVASATGLGLVLFIGVLMSFGNLPIIMICGLYALIRIWQRDRFQSLPVRLWQGAAALAGFAAPWAAMIVLAGFDLPATYQTAMRIHLELKRDYWPFVVWHPWDIFTFVGLPLVSIALIMTWRQAPALTFAWVATIATQSLLHVARGETGRVWMYFAPVIVALAGMWLAHHPATKAPNGLRPGVWPRSFVVALAVIQAIAHIALLRVIGYGVDPVTVPNATLPADLTPANIRFEPNGEVQLLGYTLAPTLKPGQPATLNLYWKLDSDAPLPTARKVFVHVADTPADEYRIVNQDGRPANWTLPTTCWLPGQIIHDPHHFAVADDARPGEYYVLIGLYDEFTGERAFVHTAQIAVANAVALPTKLTITSPDLE
ncbi:MAG: hypothetical protein RMN52_16365 [Anaerolineae bacterium]|nr:hypothetical protein [Candidatus Roseilinea sp.]MDW8451574.1 hypothetical protein [Anaerolineae bacterium]